jgi:hypothetical protein
VGLPPRWALRLRRIVGRNGLGPLLAALHAQSPAVRVHLTTTM